MTQATTWTLEDLQALEKSIAKGVVKVKYTDKEIEYRSLDEMFQLRDAMKRALGCSKKTRRCVMTTSKGLC